MPQTFLIPDALLSADLAHAVLGDIPLPHFLRHVQPGALEPLPTEGASLYSSAWRFLRQQLAPQALSCAPAPVLWPWLHHPPKLDFAPAWIALADPVHLAITGEGLVLGKLTTSVLPNAERLRFLEMANACFDEVDGPARRSGLRLQLVADGALWLLCANQLLDFEAPALAHMLGAPLRAHATQGQDAGRLNVILNELQMHWHASVANQQRDERGLPSVNGLWLHGSGAVLSDAQPTKVLAQTVLCGAWPGSDCRTAQVVWCPQLSEAVQQNDWASWQESLLTLLTQVETAASQSGETIRLVLGGKANLRAHTLTPGHHAVRTLWSRLQSKQKRHLGRVALFIG